LGVSAAGGGGAPPRFWLGIGVTWLLGPSFPWGTLLINVLGSFVIGMAGSATNGEQHAVFRAFLMVGVCGGFTTFSSFSLQTLDLLQSGRGAAAMGYVALSVLLCLVAVWAGWMLGRLEWV
jgi:CrcB protein